VRKRGRGKVGKGVARKRVLEAEMAIRLSKAFGGSAESWITQQAQYDLWQALQKTDVTGVKAFA